MKKYIFFAYLGLVSLSCFAGRDPSELSENMSKFSTVMVWAMKIGGVACVIIPIYLLATNKLQGAVASTILTIIIVVGAALSGVSWYISKQKDVAESVGSGARLMTISKPTYQVKELK